MGEAAQKFLNEDSGSSPRLIDVNVFRAGGALMLRQVLVQFIGAVTGIILARTLSPEQFGYYAIFTFAYFALLAPGDLGLGASLVRQKSEPAVKQCRQVFTVRQLMDCLLLFVVWIAAPFIASVYEMGNDGVAAVRLMTFAALLHSFQIIPLVLMERSMRFTSIAVVEVVQAFVFAGSVVYLSSAGWGLLSFPIAWVLFSICGALLANLMHPWSFGWKINMRFVRARLPFSLPYQAASAASLGKDAVTPVLVGIVLGAAGVGYINWAQMLAMIVGLAVTVLHRVCFAAFARIRSDRAKLGEMIQTSLRLAHMFVALPSILILIYAVPITEIVFGAKWLAALPIFYALWPANLIVPTLQPVLAALNALGKSGKVLWFSLGFTAAFWLAAAILVNVVGVAGYAPAFLLYHVFSLYFIRTLKQFDVSFSVSRAAIPVWLLAAAAALGGSVAAQLSSLSGLVEFMLAGVVSLCIYAVLVRYVLFDRSR